MLAVAEMPEKMVLASAPRLAEANPSGDTCAIRTSVGLLTLTVPSSATVTADGAASRLSMDTVPRTSPVRLTPMPSNEPSDGSNCANGRTCDQSDG